MDFCECYIKKIRRLGKVHVFYSPSEPKVQNALFYAVAVHVHY